MRILRYVIPQPPIHEVMPKTAETIFNIFIFIPLGIALAIAVASSASRAQGPAAAVLHHRRRVRGDVRADRRRPRAGLPQGGGRARHLHDLRPDDAALHLLRLPVVRRRPRLPRLPALPARRHHKELFRLWALDCVVDIALETPGILAGTYLYYGKQPFDLWGFPIWWGFVNPVMPMVAGALIYKLRPHLTSRGSCAAVIPLHPDGRRHRQRRHRVADVDRAQPERRSRGGVTYTAGFVTLGLALFAVWIISLVVARPKEHVEPLNAYVILSEWMSRRSTRRSRRSSWASVS